MKKITVLSMLTLALFIVACSAENTTKNNEDILADAQNDASQTKSIDVNNDDDKDVQITTSENSAEVVVDMDEVVTIDIPAVKDYCIPGSTYTYENNEGNSDSKIIGLEPYKGKTWCRAESMTEINSPIGKITTQTTYYFDNTYKEYWILTTTNTPGMASQTNEVHIVDGKVQ